MNEVVPDAQMIPWLEIVGGVFLLIGLVCLVPAIRTLREEIDSRSWPQIEAKLQSAESVKTIYQENEKRNYRTFVRYQVELQYRYEIDGREYSAVTRKVAASEAEAAGLANEASIGEGRMLYYNPERPERYRFVFGSLMDALFWFIPVAGFGGFGALVFYVGRKFY